MTTIEKVNNRPYLLDTTAQQITFLDSRFYRTDDGSFVPSVTTILEAYPKGAAFYEWLKKNGEDSDAIRDEAGRRGSAVHDFTERYDNGEEVSLLDIDGNIQCKLGEWAMFERYVEFRSRFPFEIIHNEARIASPKLGFAGTIDRVINLNGQNVLIDIKTSAYVWPSYWLQLAAYEQLITESYGYNPIERVAILHLNAKTRTEGKAGTIQGKGWQLIFRTEEETEKDWQLFKATHQLWLAENGGMKPKETSYRLVHKYQ